jgi:hypothetical protein
MTTLIFVCSSIRWLARIAYLCIVTHCGLDSQGIRFQWGWDFPYPSRLDMGPTQPPVQWVLGHLPWGRVVVACRWSYFHLLPRLKSWAIPLLLLWTFMACARGNFTLLTLQHIMCCEHFVTKFACIRYRLCE